MQVCDAELRRLIILGGRCAVGQPPASTTGRQLPVGARAGLPIDAKKNCVRPDLRHCICLFIVAHLAMFQVVRGLTCLWRPAALPRGAFCACRPLCWLRVHLLNTMLQFLRLQEMHCVVAGGTAKRFFV